MFLILFKSVAKSYYLHTRAALQGSYSTFKMCPLLLVFVHLLCLYVKSFPEGMCIVTLALSLCLVCGADNLSSTATTVAQPLAGFSIPTLSSPFIV